MSEGYYCRYYMVCFGAAVYMCEGEVLLMYVLYIMVSFLLFPLVLEPVMLYTVGFVSYLAADLFAFSGIVRYNFINVSSNVLYYIVWFCSLITCAIIMKHYVAANIAWKSNITFKYTLKMLKWVWYICILYIQCTVKVKKLNDIHVLRSPVGDSVFHKIHLCACV